MRSRSAGSREVVVLAAGSWSWLSRRQKVRLKVRSRGVSVASQFLPVDQFGCQPRFERRLAAHEFSGVVRCNEGLGGTAPMPWAQVDHQAEGPGPSVASRALGDV